MAEKINVLDRLTLIQANTHVARRRLKKTSSKVKVYTVKIKAGTRPKVKKERRQYPSNVREKDQPAEDAKAKNNSEERSSADKQEQTLAGRKDSSQKTSETIQSTSSPISTKHERNTELELPGNVESTSSKRQSLLKLIMKISFQSIRSDKMAIKTLSGLLDFEEEEKEEKIFVVNMMNKVDEPKLSDETEVVKKYRPNPEADSYRSFSFVTREQFNNLMATFAKVLEQYERDAEEEVLEQEVLEEEESVEYERRETSLSDPLAAITISNNLSKVEKMIEEMLPVLEEYVALKLKSNIQLQSQQEMQEIMDKTMITEEIPTLIASETKTLIMEEYPVPIVSETKTMIMEELPASIASETSPKQVHKTREVKTKKKSPESSIQLVQSAKSVSSSRLTKPISNLLEEKASVSGQITTEELKEAVERQRNYFNEKFCKKEGYVNFIADKALKNAQKLNYELRDIVIDETICPVALEESVANFTKRIDEIVSQTSEMLRATQEELDNMVYTVDDILDNIADTLAGDPTDPQLFRDAMASFQSFENDIFVTQDVQEEFAYALDMSAADLQMVKHTLNNYSSDFVHRDQLEELLKAKVDLAQVNGFVTSMFFEAAIGQLYNRFKGFYFEMVEERWQKVIDKNYMLLSERAEKSEVDLLFADIRDKVEILRDRIDYMLLIAQTYRSSEPDEYYSRRQPYRATACVSCSRSATKLPPRGTGLQPVVSPTEGAEAPKFEEGVIPTRDDGVCVVGRKVPHPIHPRAGICTTICGSPEKQPFEIMIKRIYKTKEYALKPCMPCNLKPRKPRKAAVPTVEPAIPSPEPKKPSPVPSEEPSTDHGLEGESISEQSLERYLKYSRYWKESFDKESVISEELYKAEEENKEHDEAQVEHREHDEDQIK